MNNYQDASQANQTLDNRVRTRFTGIADTDSDEGD
jgi:hypothetical protein